MYEWADRNYMVKGGDYPVSDKHDLTLCTVLGSCISACLYDPVAGIGGMNHYLLPYNSGPHGSRDVLNARYGHDAFILLLRRLVRRGAASERLVAKIYGGAQMLNCEVEIGRTNIDLAESFLQERGIPIIASDVGGRSARWVNFQPASGESNVRIAGRRAPVPEKRSAPWFPTIARLAPIMAR